MCNTLPNGVCTLNHIPIVFCVGFLSITICGFCVRVGFTLRFGSSDDRFCLVRLFHGYNSIDSAGNWQIAAVFCFICSESTQPSHTRFFPERFFVLYIAIMTLSIVQGFSKSLAMTVLSEIGDKTFFAAAILAMRHPRRYVLAGCLTALIVMTILSAAVGMAAPNLISRTLSKHITTVLFFGFGLWSLWDAYKDGDSEELAEVEAELDANVKPNSGTTNKGDDDSKKKKRPLLTQFFSPIFLKAFSITFFGEWGDKSQLATIGLAAAENPLGVVLGGILGQALCQTAAVFGGKSLATQISERFIALSGGVLFLVFGLQSLFSTVES